MKKRKEISLLGALVICAVALAVHKLLQLPEPNNPKITGLTGAEEALI